MPECPFNDNDRPIKRLTLLKCTSNDTYLIIIRPWLGDAAIRNIILYAYFFMPLMAQCGLKKDQADEN